MALGSLAAMLSGCHRTPPSTGKTAGPVEITIWHPWGSIDAEKMRAMIERYHRSQNRVRVRMVYTPTDLSTNQKLFTAVAAGKPPDLAFVDATQNPQWIERGALRPLDDFVKRDHVNPADFYPPCWRQEVYKGHVWSLPYCADPNFVLLWNRNVFRRAGLDPNRPPKTIAELDRMAAACTKEEDGRLETIGIIPWAQYGPSNSVFTWGWVFGGSFFNDRTQTVTANDPRVVQALTWMVGYAKRLGITRINASTASWGAGVNDPFITGQLAMTCAHVSRPYDLHKYAPDLDYGIAPMPGLTEKTRGTTWVGGWSVIMPRGCPHPEAAWDFLHWMCATPEGTNAVAEETGFLPGYRKSPAIARMKKNPRMRVFVNILETAQHQRPCMAAEAYLVNALDRAVDQTLYGKQTPQQALDLATHSSQRELDLVLGRKVE